MIEVKLSRRQRILKRNIEEIRENKRTYDREIGGLIHNLCKFCEKHGHYLRPRELDIDEKLKTDRCASTGVYCEVCGESFGWYCPKSPDHKCHYSRTADCCDYCHEPEERK